MRAGNLDEAVAAYRKAVQAAPDNANYKIAMSRALIAASRAHLEKAREFEAKDQLEAALGEYKLASEYDPSNRVATAKVAELDRTIRDRIEASRPKPPIVAMRERARAASAEPMLNPASRDPLNIHFNNTPLKDILTFLVELHRHQHHLRPRSHRSADDGQSRRPHARTGAEPDHDDEPAVVQGHQRSVDLRVSGHDDETRAVRRAGGADVLSLARGRDRGDPDAEHDHPAAGHFGAAGDCAPTRPPIRLPCGPPARWWVFSRRSSSRTTSRGPRSSIDVEILEVDRVADEELRPEPVGVRARRDLLARGVARAARPRRRTGCAGSAGHDGHQSTPPSGVRSPPPFNLNTISRGVSTADFYLAVPTAIVRFLESDTRTKVIAKPQLRGAEGTKLTMKLGDKVPVISTELHADRDRWRGREPAELVQLSGRRRAGRR